MEFTPPDSTSTFAFVCILVAVELALCWGVYVAYRSLPKALLFAGLSTAWLAYLCWLVGSGLLPSLPLNGLPHFIVPTFLLILGLGLSPFGRQLAASLPLPALVGFQCFRLPLELVLHSWATQGTIPTTMTWTGQNWDIISGIAALVCAPFCLRSRSAAIVANLVGGVLLLNVIRVAILSSPVPFGWNSQPPLQLAFHLPYALIVPVCVGGALFGHVVLTRALLRQQPAK